VNRLTRLPLYCRALATSAGTMAAFEGEFDLKFIRTLECCAPLIDIGELALPDHLLLKPGQLNREEQAILQSHTNLGAELVARAAGRHSVDTLFFRMAVDVVRHHHERWDGRGFPDQLVGEYIPLAARVVAIADAYDEHRTRRPHKPPLSHAIAIQLIRTAEGRFDPRLLDALEWCEADFLQTFQTYPG
jgi:putative two-component system response regulator